MPYKLRVPDQIVRLIRGMHPLLKKRIRAALNEICLNPSIGKSLREELSGLKSYRIKKFRIIYQVIKPKEINIIAIGPRKTIYEETFRLVKKNKKSWI